MDCRQIEFAPNKSEERIKRALQVFPKVLLIRLLAFALHLLGAKRRSVAALVGMQEESVKTVIRLVLRDGFPALRDRRRADTPPVSQTPPNIPSVTVRRQNDWLIVNFGTIDKPLRILCTSQIHARTVLLSLVNAGLLSAQETASVLSISAAHCRELARKLEGHDVIEALVDKRKGQKREYRVNPETKAEIIQQLVARAIVGRSTASDTLADAVNEKTQAGVSPRTIRWHIQKLGLTNIKKTLPKLVETLKKTS